MALRANRWLVTGAVTAAVLGLAGFGLGAASASSGGGDADTATPTSAPTTVTPASTSAEQATPLADELDEPDVQAFLDCLRGQGVEVPEVTGGDFSLQWQDGKLTINGTVIDLAAVGDALEACKAQLPDVPPLPGFPGLDDLEGLEDLGDLGDLGPFGEDARQLAECLSEKGYDFPFGLGGWLGDNADADALITILERTADALRARLDAGAESDVEQRLAALDAAIEALKADAANAPDPGNAPDADPGGLKEAFEACKAELGDGD